MSKPPRSTLVAEQGPWPGVGAHSGANPAAVRGGPWQRSSPPVWTGATRSQLETEFRAVLSRGVHGLCFSPYLEGQAPGAAVSEAQIRERLQLIQPCAGWVRTFS